MTKRYFLTENNGFSKTVRELTETEQMNAFLKKVEEINEKNARSAWGRGVGEYAMEIAARIVEEICRTGLWRRMGDNRRELFLSYALNGAQSWRDYSHGGCSLIYDGDIAERLCTPSELKKTRNGERSPNSREGWLDVQARALYQASRRVFIAAVESGLL